MEISLIDFIERKKEELRRFENWYNGQDLNDFPLKQEKAAFVNAFFKFKELAINDK